MSKLFYELKLSFELYFSVGNKNDDPGRKVVITEDAQRFANQMDIQLFETSAKDNINVEEMFLAITEQVLRHKKQTQKQVPIRIVEIPKEHN